MASEEEPTFIDRSEEEGYNIVERIRERDVNPGGSTVELIGAPGCGKTSAFLNFVEDFVGDELVFWRDSFETPLQFIKGFQKYKIFVENSLNLEIVDMNNGGERLDLPFESFEDVPKIDYKVELSNDPNEEDVEKNEQGKRKQDEIFKNILSEAEIGKLNVLFFNKRYSWIDLLRYLKEVPSYQDVFLDEYEDIFPYQPSGEEYQRVAWAQKNIKQLRKGLVNLFCNTQSKSDVSWRIRKKMNITGYMRGGVPDKDSPVKKHAVSGLSKGQVFFDWEHSNFGKVKFKPRYANEDAFYVARRIPKERQVEEKEEYTQGNRGRNVIEQRL